MILVDTLLRGACRRVEAEVGERTDCGRSGFMGPREMLGLRIDQWARMLEGGIPENIEISGA
jgi:hypothetical protein